MFLIISQDETNAAVNNYMLNKCFPCKVLDSKESREVLRLTTALKELPREGK